MALNTLGNAPQRVVQSHAGQSWVAKIANGCLTTPFDRDAVRCVEERRNLPHCLDELVLRAPEREEAVMKLLESARQHPVR
jgi:hypothetical protein